MTGKQFNFLCHQVLFSIWVIAFPLSYVDLYNGMSGIQSPVGNVVLVLLTINLRLRGIKTLRLSFLVLSSQIEGKQPVHGK